MFDQPEAAATAQRWVEKAEADLFAAAGLLKLGQKRSWEATCFHAQQCVEKYLKGLLVWRGEPFPRTHDLTALMELLPPADRPDLSPDEQDRMTRYATITRYPGDYDPLMLSEARNAVKIARRIRREVRKRLPKEALRPSV